MNTQEFINQMAEDSGLSKTECRRAFENVVATLSKAFQDNDRIILKDLGVFKVVDRAPRTGRNPTTGARMEIPAKKAIVFKAATGITL